MNAPFKTFALAGLISLLSLAANSVSAADYPLDNCADPDTLALKSDAPDKEDEFDYDFENPFQFADQVVITILNACEEQVYHKVFEKDEIADDLELQEMLKHSDYMLAVGNEYYYLLRK